MQSSSTCTFRATRRVLVTTRSYHRKVDMRGIVTYCRGILLLYPGLMLAVSEFGGEVATPLRHEPHGSLQPERVWVVDLGHQSSIEHGLADKIVDIGSFGSPQETRAKAFLFE